MDVRIESEEPMGRNPPEAQAPSSERSPGPVAGRRGGPDGTIVDRT